MGSGAHQRHQTQADRHQASLGHGRLLTGKTADPSVRLPPGQRLVMDWPVLDVGIQPDVIPAKWRERAIEDTCR
jgi:hypothetical protein